MSGKMDWKRVQDEDLARTNGTASIKVDKTSPEAFPENTDTIHDLAQKNPALRKMLRDFQSGKYGKDTNK